MVTPYFANNDVVIYHARWEAVLPQLSDQSIDLILSDPPFGVSYVTGHRIKGDPMKVPIANDESLQCVRDIMPHLDRLLKNDRHAYMFGGVRKVGELQDIIAQYWKIKNVLVWDKGDAGTVGDLVSGYGYNYEMIVYAMKGSRPLGRPRPRTLFRYNWSASNDPVHPARKPPGIFMPIIRRSSMPGETILDPFAGTCPVAEAAVLMGRKAICCELEERYIEKAAIRLSQGVLFTDVA